LSIPVEIGVEYKEEKYGRNGIVIASDEFVTIVNYENEREEYLTSYINSRI